MSKPVSFSENSHVLSSISLSLLSKECPFISSYIYTDYIQVWHILLTAWVLSVYTAFAAFNLFFS